MPFNHVLKTLWRHRARYDALISRGLHHDGRYRLSNFWTPTQSKKQLASTDTAEDGHDLLLRAGYLRQAHSGIFHLLPLGLRVQDKIERLIDKHMQSLGASKVSLSSITSQELWRKSGRLEGRGSELFHLQDRKDAKYLLSPTHEEEITTIVKHAIHSYKDLPLRLYQVSRKYRDEARPRQGLLRGREFVMKDLYTFDITEESAMIAYEAAQNAYRGFLDELRLPYLVANADSGNMGGSHSHEYHFISTRGEDTIITCSNCDLCINEELYVGKHSPTHNQQSVTSGQGSDEKHALTSDAPVEVWYGRVFESEKPSIDASASEQQEPESASEGRTERAALLRVFLPGGPFELNTHAIKKIFPGVNTGDPVNPSTINGDIDPTRWSRVVSIRDPRVSVHAIMDGAATSTDTIIPLNAQDIKEAPVLLTKARHEDPCPACDAHNTLHFQQAVEIGHTFHLGTRYSTALEAVVQNERNEVVKMQMGCHGVGVSRILGAIATLLADSNGLNWPICIAPFGVLLSGAGNVSEEDVREVYDRLGSELRGSTDLVIDDRDRPFGWKLKDADIVGYPFIVVLGRAWSQRRAVEVQCRRLGVKKEVALEELAQKLKEYMEQL